MPSVGSTPTTTSPAQQQQQPQHQQQQPKTTQLVQHPKLQQQQSLPLQLQYHQHHQLQHQTPTAAVTVTTTQPSPAGIISTASSGIGISNGGDISPLSSSNSFSSVDTNQTLLNSIANQTTHAQPPAKQRTVSSSSSGRGGVTAAAAPNRLYNTKYSQFMIITPAVSIDREFENAIVSPTVAPNSADFNGDAYFNGNIFRTSLLQSSIDSGNSSDSSGGSFRSNYNPYLHNSRQHLLPKTTAPHTFYTFSSSWRWCTLICAAMRCFGAGRSSANAGTTVPTYYAGGYQQHTSSTAPHRRLRPSNSFTAETAFEHFSAPFATPRKTRDHLNNLTYEL